jgi:ABC-type uncharacterized transport system involved in gliding motility auxiliary subunit
VIDRLQFIHDGIFEQQLNSNMFLNSVGWFNERCILETARCQELIPLWLFGYGGKDAR